MSRFAITLPEYNRVHQIIHGTIKEEGNVGRACTFFSIVGSYLLNKKFGIPARAVAGGFALCVADGPKCVFYGKDKGGKFGWGEDGFHMWVQTEHHIVDFMAPIYAESFADVQTDLMIPRRMFQKLKADDKQTLDELATVGDYIVFPDPDLSEQLIDSFLSRPVNTDLLQIAEVWFGNDGFIRKLTLPTTIASSTW
jgi:hypothetical protein